MRRTFDVLVAAAATAVLAPVIAVLAVVVRSRLGRPVLFRQERAGLGGRPFTMWKLRTMTDERGPDGALLPDNQRLTAFGRGLRATSLDELPELWNVLRGEMSLVGPRPLPVTYRHRYTVAERRWHDVRPGITGWAQVNGRNALAWDERLDLDVWYVDHRSIAVDLRIMARTLAAVVGRTGISAEGEATMFELRPHLGGAPP